MIPPIGNAIRLAREYHGLNQIEAAEALGITTTHLSCLEKDTILPDIKLIDHIETTWGINVYVHAWNTQKNK